MIMVKLIQLVGASRGHNCAFLKCSPLTSSIIFAKPSNKLSTDCVEPTSRAVRQPVSMLTRVRAKYRKLGSTEFEHELLQFENTAVATPIFHKNV